MTLMFFEMFLRHPKLVTGFSARASGEAACTAAKLHNCSADKLQLTMAQNNQLLLTKFQLPLCVTAAEVKNR